MIKTEEIRKVMEEEKKYYTGFYAEKTNTIYTILNDICKRAGLDLFFEHSGSDGSKSAYFSIGFCGEEVSPQYRISDHTNYKCDDIDIDLRDSDEKISETIFNIIRKSVNRAQKVISELSISDTEWYDEEIKKLNQFLK